MAEVCPGGREKKTLEEERARELRPSSGCDGGLGSINSADRAR